MQITVASSEGIVHSPADICYSCPKFQRQDGECGCPRALESDQLPSFSSCFLSLVVRGLAVPVLACSWGSSEHPLHGVVVRINE